MVRARRRTELGLLLLAALIVTGAYALASLSRAAALPGDLGWFIGVVVGLFVVGHLAIRRLASDADPLLLPLAGLLNGLGFVFIARMNADLAAAQAMWSLVGMAGFVVTLGLIRRTRSLESYRYSFAALGIGLLLLPSLPVIGREINGAQIWISVGPMSFQPAEAAKLALAAFLAGYLVDKRELLALSSRRLGPLYLPDPRHLGPLLVAWGVSLLVMVNQKDLGSSLLFFTLFVVLVWVATGRAAYLVLGGLLFGAGAFGAYHLFGHVRDRVSIWLDPWPVAKGAGYQVVEAAFAMADGGLTGTGLGLGNAGRIPARETDFIFAVVAEELGLVGATAVLLAYLLLIGCGLRIALQSDYPFEKLFATGLTTLLGFQAFVIVAGVTRVLPLTGVTLPFMSFGGSSLLANYVLIALLVRISDETAKRTTVVQEDPQRPVGVAGVGG